MLLHRLSSQHLSVSESSLIVAALAEVAYLSVIAGAGLDSRIAGSPVVNQIDRVVF